MRYTFILIFSCLFLNIHAADIRDSFLVDGVYRNYILHTPTGYTTTKNYPLVLNLHGYTSNADQQMLYSGMNGTADANEFLVVYPNGIANYWNSFGSGADDVKFLDTLIERLSRTYKIDRNCVYSCGMSNGGFMSYTLACQLSHKIAAIASVTGVISSSTQANCNIAHKMPVMQIHGTADPTVNYQTGTANATGVEQTLDFWINKNNCLRISDTTDVPNTNLTDGCTAQLIRYRQCDAPAEVYFYKIAGGQHTWPDAAFTIAVTNRDFNASTEIWNFFKRHKLNQPNGIELSSAEKAGIAIYPSPIANNFSIETTRFVAQSIQVFDLSGRVVFATSKATNNLQINTTDWAKGFYIVSLVDESNNSYTAKVVKD